MKRRIFALTSALAALAVMISGCARPNLPMTTLEPKSDLAQWIYRLFIEITIWDAIVMVIVLGSFILAIFVFSTRVGDSTPTQPSAAHSDVGLEVAWTVGPALILLFIAIPTVRTIFRSQPEVAPTGSLEIKVIAHQWWWEFQYPSLNIKTANELHIPTGRPIRMNLISADVIHSFWVPALGAKRDVIPGQQNELTFIADVPGEYWGQCTEFCGDSHANMRLRAFVQTPADFDKWVKDQTTLPKVPDSATNAAGATGATIFANSPCTTCHRIDGVSKGFLGPDLSHFGTRTTLAGAILPNTPQNVAKWITDPDAIKPGAHMPVLGMRGKKLNDLVAYLESLK
jgi:cytochrome c oxidase subunit II